MEKAVVNNRVFYRKLIHLTLPISFQALMLAAVAAADAIMLGSISQDSMAAVSLATQIQFVQNMFLYAITGAGSILAAQYWGKGDKRTIQDLFWMMLRLCGFVSVLFFSACVFAPGILMRVFTNESGLVAIGAGYLRLAGFSYLLTGISQCYLTIMKVTEKAGCSALISTGAVLINIALNAVFIYGLFGVPAMGARGAALATLIARILELGAAVASSFQKGFLAPPIRRIFHRDRLLAGDFRRCCLPLLGGALFWGVGFTSYTAIMGHLGADAAAANSVAAVVRDLMCCVGDGVSRAGGILVGNELGAGNLARGKAYGDKLMRMSFLIGLLSMAIVLSVIPLVMGIIVLTETATHYLRGMMVIMAIYMIGRVVNTIVINGIFGAGGDTLFDMYSLAVCMWGIAIPLALLGGFVFHWPVLAVYACTCVDEVGKIPWVMLHYRKYRWVKDLTRVNEGD